MASNNSALDESSFQDIALCIKGLLLTNQLSGGQTFKLLGSFGGMLPLSRYEINQPVAIGHRSSNVDARLIGQLDFGNGAYAAVQTGYIFRSDVSIDSENIDVPNALDLITRVGYGTRSFYADIWANLQQSEAGTDIGSGIPFPSNAISFFRIGSTFYLPFTQQVGAGVGVGYTVSGENVGKAFRISGGLVYRMMH